MAKERQGKSTGRRRPNAKGESRSVRVEITLTPSEKKRIDVLARQSGVSVPHLYELSVWSGGVEAAVQVRHLQQELYMLRRGLAGALNNINQMAHYANVEHAQHPDSDAAKASLVEQMAKIDAVLDDIPRGRY